MQSGHFRQSFLYRRIFNWPGAIFLLAVGGMMLYLLAYFYCYFIAVKVLDIETLEYDKCEMRLPVHYIWGGYRPYSKGVLAQTKNEWRYTIRPGASPPDLMITVSRQEFGGWVVYEARYQISDPATRAKLWQLAKDKQKLLDGE